MHVNKVIILGRLGRDPEVQFQPNGDAICVLSLGTTETWRDRETGENKEATDWHRVVLHRKNAEVAGEHLHRGSHAYVEGKSRTRKYTDAQGVERTITEIIGEQLRLVGDPPHQQQPQQQPQQQQQQQQQQQPQQQQQQQQQQQPQQQQQQQQQQQRPQQQRNGYQPRQQQQRNNYPPRQQSNPPRSRPHAPPPPNQQQQQHEETGGTYGDYTPPKDY